MFTHRCRLLLLGGKPGLWGASWLQACWQETSDSRTRGVQSRSIHPWQQDVHDTWGGGGGELETRAAAFQIFQADSIFEQNVCSADDSWRPAWASEQVVPDLKDFPVRVHFYFSFSLILFKPDHLVHFLLTSSLASFPLCKARFFAPFWSVAPVLCLLIPTHLLLISHLLPMVSFALSL